MVYELEAVIGAEPAARAAVAGLKSAVVVALPAGLALVPLTPELTEELRGRFGSIADESFPAIRGLDMAVPRWLRDASRAGRLAFVGASFWGGIGTQWAVSMLEGRIVLGPMEADDAINLALRQFGVAAAPGSDEFDAIGLGRFRRTERWAAPESGTA